MSNPALEPGTIRRFLVLVNPLSGGGAAPAAVEQVGALLRATGAEVEVVPSRDAAHSRAAVAAAASRGQIVVAAGGDGMLASLAGSVVDAGGVLGIVPSGRGNDFARMLRLGAHPEDVAHCLLEGDPTPVDVIEVADETGGDRRVVLGSLYAGVDSLASELVDGARRLPAALQYPYAAVRALLTYTPRRFTVTVDGTTHSQDAYNVVVANSGYYGKGMHIAPMADVHDGLLDVVLLPAQPRLAMVRQLSRVYDGTHVALPGVTVLRGREVIVRADPDAAGVAVLGYGDGERLGPLPRTARVRPGGINVLLP